MDLVFAYLAGLLTIINPCVLPVLPVVLIAALSEHRYGVWALCAGLTVMFVVLGTVVAAIGPALGIDETTISAGASLLMIVFGTVLLVPALSARFSMAASGMSNAMSAKFHTSPTGGLTGQAFTGALLGAVWSPCIGPTLGGAIALAAEGSNLPWAAMIMLFFAFGVSTLIGGLALLSREGLMRQRGRLQAITPYARPIVGVLLLALGLFLWFQLNHVVEGWLLDTLPAWLIDASVAL